MSKNKKRIQVLVHMDEDMFTNLNLVVENEGTNRSLFLRQLIMKAIKERQLVK